MLFRCNYLALVGGGKKPKYPPNKGTVIVYLRIMPHVSQSFFECVSVCGHV